MTNIQEVLDSLSFDNENEEVMTSNTNSSTSIPSAREVELEKKVARLTEKVEELSKFVSCMNKRLESVETCQDRAIDTMRDYLEESFDNLLTNYDEKIRRIVGEAEDNKFVVEQRKRRIAAYERQKLEAARREEIERQLLEEELTKNA